MNREKVFISKVDSYTEGNVKEMIESTMGKNGKYGKVVIKPNFCTMQNTGAVTNLTLLRHVIRYFKGISEYVVVVESDTIRESFEEVVEKLGVVDLAKDEGVELINISKLPE